MLDEYERVIENIENSLVSKRRESNSDNERPEEIINDIQMELSSIDSTLQLILGETYAS